MRTLISQLAIGAGTLAAAAAWWTSASMATPRGAAIASNSSLVVDSHNAHSQSDHSELSESTISRSDATHVRIRDDPQLDQQSEPPAFTGFWSLSETGRGDLIATIQGDPHLESSAIAFLKGVICNRRCDETTRNNAANALLYQEHIDSEVPSLMLTMFHDATESAQWRDYLVQHLAVNVASSPQPAAVVAELQEVASQPLDGVSATALLHLHRLDQQGYDCFPATLMDAVRQWVMTTSLDQRVRMSCLSIIAERSDLQARPQVRTLLTDGDQTIARQAIATLGIIGDSNDVEVLSNACSSQNEVVAGIARTALGRLRSASAPAPVSEAGRSLTSF